jgi:hypothetical protein
MTLRDPEIQEQYTHAGHPESDYDNGITAINRVNVIQQYNNVEIPMPGKNRKLTFPQQTGRVRLGVCAVRIQNPKNGQSTTVYAFHDSGSELTMLRKSTAKEIDLRGVRISQCCKGMNSTEKTEMELADLRIQGLEGNRYYTMKDIRIAQKLPQLRKSLPNTLNTDVHGKFKAISCPTISREQCDLLIGADNINLIEMVDGPDSRIVDGDLMATRTCVGWVIRGREEKRKNPPEKIIQKGKERHDDSSGNTIKPGHNIYGRRKLYRKRQNKKFITPRART